MSERFVPSGTALAYRPEPCPAPDTKRERGAVEALDTARLPSPLTFEQGFPNNIGRRETIRLPSSVPPAAKRQHARHRHAPAGKPSVAGRRAGDFRRAFLICGIAARVRPGRGRRRKLVAAAGQSGAVAGRQRSQPEHGLHAGRRPERQPVSRKPPSTTAPGESATAGRWIATRRWRRRRMPGPIRARRDRGSSSSARAFAARRSGTAGSSPSNFSRAR